MRQIILTLLLLGFLAIPFSGFSQSEYDEFKKQQREYEAFVESTNKEYQTFAKKQQDAYDAFVKAEFEAFEAFKAKAEKTWGKGNVKTSTIKDWVEYSSDLKSRSTVDFEKGEMEIEIVVDRDKANNNQYITEQLKDKVLDLLNNKGTTKDYKEGPEKRKPLAEQPILAGQVLTPVGKKITKANEKEAAKEIATSAQPVVKKIQGTDMVVVKMSYPLAPEHIRTKLDLYWNDIMKYSQRYQLDPSLVCAVIYTESYFNPKAQSHVPAYGLMQLVPRSGGADAYEYVYKQKKIPTRDYLFVPANNIELGSAYLRKLMDVYFKQIKDENCRMLCAIAAYNTGAGNVSRAFTGNTNIKTAIPKINTYSYNELYQYLRSNLPYEETRNYIKKVTERKKQFADWSKK